MRYLVNTICTATVTEQWHVEVPDDVTHPDDVKAFITDALSSNAEDAPVTYVEGSDEVSGERDREVEDYQADPA